MAPVRVLGYSIETVLAEKIATAVGPGPGNTRVRDFADVYVLTGRHAISFRVAREALLATAAFRLLDVVPLSSALGDLVELRGATYRAYRGQLGPDGARLPEDFADLVAAGSPDWRPHRSGQRIRPDRCRERLRDIRAQGGRAGRGWRAGTGRGLRWRRVGRSISQAGEGVEGGDEVPVRERVGD